MPGDSINSSSCITSKPFLYQTGPVQDLDLRKTLIERHSPPEILVHGLVTPDDVDKLFAMYSHFRMHMSSI